MAIPRHLGLLWRRFSPLEERLFAAVRSVLPARAAPIFDAQVRAIRRVQRLPRWSEIDYYPHRYGNPRWAGVPTFPRTGDFPLARVRFAVGRRGYRATLSCDGGHIFDFAITPGPRSIAFAEWDSEPSAELLSDPLDPAATAPGHEIPDAWRDALEREGPQATAGGWTLHDARTARLVTLDDAEFLVLAERDGDEFILHRVHPPGDVMFRLASHDGTPEPVQGAIADTLRGARRNA